MAWIRTGYRYHGSPTTLHRMLHRAAYEWEWQLEGGAYRWGRPRELAVLWMPKSGQLWVDGRDADLDRFLRDLPGILRAAERVNEQCRAIGWDIVRARRKQQARAAQYFSEIARRQ